MHKLSISVFTILLLPFAIGCDQKGHSAMNQPTKCSMHVWINQSIDKVSGRPWPHYQNGKPLEMTITDAPCETVLHLPSGRTLVLQSKSTRMNQNNNLVTLVSVLPLPSLVDFKTAVAKLEQAAHDVGVQDPRFYQIVQSWLQKAPNRNPFGPKYTAKANVESGVDVFAQIEPNQPEGEPDDGWFISLDFSPVRTKQY